jgi:hypothetical protein
MRGAVRGVTPLRRIRMRERAYNFSAHFRIGPGARTVLYLLRIVKTVMQPVEN